MPEFDLVIRNGTVATAADTTHCDVAIKDGVVLALGRSLGPWGARDRCLREAGPARRHRQPLPYRAALVGRGRLRRRFLQRHRRRGVRRHHHGDPVRRPASRPVVAPGGAGLPCRGAAQGGHRLRLSPDHHRPLRRHHGPGIAGPDPGWLHLVQGLHDLRSAAARRRPDARHPGGGAARGGARHGPCRKLRHDQMADRAARSSAGSPNRAGMRSATPGLPRARRPTAPSPCRSSSTCRSSSFMSRPPRRSR